MTRQQNMSVHRSYGPRQANLVFIAYASSEGSGEPAHPRSLARTSAARSYKQWVKRNLQTESQIPGPSEWLGMWLKFIMTECSKTQIRLTGLIQEVTWLDWDITIMSTCNVWCQCIRASTFKIKLQKLKDTVCKNFDDIGHVLVTANIWWFL